MTLTEYISQLKELESKATKGRWEYYQSSHYLPSGPVDEVLAMKFDKTLVSVTHGTTNDIKFIAAARNSLPRLIQVIEVMRDALMDIGDGRGYEVKNEPNEVYVARRALTQVEAICGKEMG